MEPKKKKAILFVRHYGVIGNLGDKLISKATDEYLNKLSEQESFEYRTASFVPYTKFGKFGFSNLIKGFFFGISQAYRCERIVMIGGNLVIPNNSKFSLCFFYYFLLSRVFCARFSTFGVGISKPSNKKTWSQRLYTVALKKADYIGVRDQHSVNAASDLLLKEIYYDKIRLMHDCAFLFDTKYFKKPLTPTRVAVIPVNFYSATCNENVVQLSEEDYIKFYQKLLELLLDNGAVPFILCTDKADEIFAKQISQNLDIDIKAPKTVNKLFEELSSVHVIAARMHGIIAALLAGNNVVGLNWQHKVKSLSEKEEITFSCFDFNEQHLRNILEALYKVHSEAVSEKGISLLYSELNNELKYLVNL